MVLAGAFKRSLLKRGAAGVKMLWQHNAAEPIGVWTSIVEDARGLKVTGRLDLSVARAREALSLMRGGAVDGLSIGFRTKRATTEKSSGSRRLHEIDLWEISIVTFPMLTQARVERVKRAPVSIDAVIAQLARLRQHRAAERFEAKLLRFSLERRYALDQPRVPAGSPDGGQWTSGGGFLDGGFSGARDDRARRREEDGRVQTALNANPRVASDVDASITLVQVRGGGRDRGRGFGGPGEATPSQLDRLEDTARLAREAETRVREIEPLWKPEPALIDPNNIEARIARYDSVRRQADARYADFLFERYGEVVRSGRGASGPKGVLTGPPAAVRTQDDAETRRGAERENDSAAITWLSGHNVERNPNVDGPKRPDYRIDGELFDNYAPRTGNARNIWRNVSDKIDAKQAPNIVINLADSDVRLSELDDQFRIFPVSGLNRLWIIDRNGKLIYLRGVW